MNIKIAFRNILRNKRRSLLTLLLITASVAILFLINGYIAVVYWALRNGAIATYGHIQIASKGFWTKNDNNRYILSGKQIEIITNILRTQKEVQEYTYELKFYGIIGTETKSTIVNGIGVEPESFYAQNMELVEGKNIFKDDYDRILIGRGVKEKIGVNENEHVTIMCTTISGAYNLMDATISGVIAMQYKEMESIIVYVPIQYAKTLINTDGVDKIILKIKNEEDVLNFSKKLVRIFNESKIDVEVRRWDELASFYHELKNWYDVIFYFISFIVFILVFLAIFEIMSISFYERFEEIGCLRAIGAKRYQIFKMLMTEGIILGSLGIVFGLAMGFIAGKIINAVHFTYCPPGSGKPVPLMVFNNLKFGIYPSIIAFLASLLSSLPPAYHAARLDVVEVLRHL